MKRMQRRLATLETIPLPPKKIVGKEAKLEAIIVTTVVS
jgi:hypothetical protein